jgi:hypothetical protein
MKQKTPMQELIFVIRKRQEDEDVQPFMWLEQIVELAESMLEKEKEVMCEFADDYQRNCFQKSADDYFKETFNTKEK